MYAYHFMLDKDHDRKYKKFLLDKPLPEVLSVDII